VKKEDPDALARGIDALLADPARAATLARNARAWVAPRYGIETMLDRMEQVFMRAIAEKRR